MRLIPSFVEKEKLDFLWKSQKKVKGPLVDFETKHWPILFLKKYKKNGIIDFKETFRKFFNWSGWIRFYKKPSLALIDAGKMARDLKKNLNTEGIMWMSPGCDVDLQTSHENFALVVLRTDWIPDFESVNKVQEQVKKRGSVLLLDESVTAFRLPYGGARNFYKLSPDLLLFDLQFNRTMRFVILAGKKENIYFDEKFGCEYEYDVSEMVASELSEVYEEFSFLNLSLLGRILLLGISYFSKKVGFSDEIYWEGPLSLPRLKGKKIWAFLKLAEEEGIRLAPLVMLNPLFSLEKAEKVIWSRLVRVFMRLKMEEHNPSIYGWKDTMALR